MPNAVNFNTPPKPGADADASLRQMYNWLFQMTEQLNVALSVVSSGEQAVMVGSQGDGGGGENDALDAAREEINTQRNELKALIIKTADTVRHEFDQRITQMESSFVAESEFGQYQEEVTRQIEDTAQGTLETYVTEIGLDSYINDSAGLKAWQSETSGFIRRGYITRNAEDVPILGIAVGQDIQTKYVDAEGNEQIDVSKTNLGFFTADGLEFYINGVNVASFRNDGANMNNATISGKLQVGNWMITHNNGFDIAWIGGE